MANSVDPVDPDLEQSDLGTHYLTSLSENFCLSLTTFFVIFRPACWPSNLKRRGLTCCFTLKTVL